MARIPLLGGAYSSASLIANAQRSVNLYPETNPDTSQAPVNVTHYPRPGLTPLGAPPNPGRGRALYCSTLGKLYAVVGRSVYFIDAAFQFNKIGEMTADLSTPVSMADNSTSMLLVDGSPTGSVVSLSTNVMAPITDPNFLGADRIDFLDYFLILNQPATPNWYATNANSVVFNALSFGTKTAWPDNCIGVIACERVAWVFGPKKAEVWGNAGLIPFPFQALSGNIVEHGSAAKYSFAKQDVNVYWLSQSPEGALMVMRGTGNVAHRISTHAIEEQFLKYQNPSDAVGATYQIRGHAFYCLHFQADDRTWVFDEATQQWHEEAYFDNNGIQHRTRDVFMAYAYGRNLSLDWATGQLYQRDEKNFSDNGNPIVFIRSLPHVIDGDNEDRITLWRVIADMEAGNGPGFQVPTSQSPWSLGFSSGFGPAILIEPPYITLRVSRDRGASFDTVGLQPMGAQGQYNKRPTWNRLGAASDFVLELSWAGPMQSALNGVFAVTEKHEADE